MPYIYCERCATGSYSNVLSCPKCGAQLRPVRVRTFAGHGVGHFDTRRDDIVEDEVRETLYGWHSGCVELHQHHTV